MKKALSLVLLMCVGIGIGVGISELGKHLHTQEFIPNQYEPTAQSTLDSQNGALENLHAQDTNTQGAILENLDNDSQALVQGATPLLDSQNLRASPSQNAQSQDILDSKNPNMADTTQENAQDPALQSAIAQDIFSQERQIPQFQEYPANLYQGQFMSADESCVNCEGGPQEALKRGIIDFGGKYALYKIQPNNGEIIVGAVNVENGEVLEFPTIYKEVAPPFDVSVLAKPDSALIWLKGVDSKNPDAYKIEAYVLQNGNLKRVQSFAIGFTISESLDSPSTPTQEQSQDEEQEVGF